MYMYNVIHDFICISVFVQQPRPNKMPTWILISFASNIVIQIFTTWGCEQPEWSSRTCTMLVYLPNSRPGNETVAVCFTQWRSGASSGPMSGGMHGVNA